MYTALYIHRKEPGENKPYYRTIRANDLNEAIKIADNYARKGYICLTLKSCYAMPVK